MAQELLEQDQKILENTRSLCQQLEITNYKPIAVAWQSMILGGGRRSGYEMPFDEVQLMQSQIIMPAGMRGRLEPDEWKPIIASALIASKKLRGQMAERIIVGAAVFVAIAVILFLTLPGLFPQPVQTCKGGSCGTGPLGYMLALFISFPLVAIGTGVLGVFFIKKLKLTADLRAAELLGTAYILSILNKIASMIPPELAQAKPRGAIFPSLQQRIKNLQTQQQHGPAT